METKALTNFLFVIPLDHPFKLTADYQNQTAQILSRKYNFKVLAYKSFENQVRPWHLLSKKTRTTFIDKSYGKNILTVSPLHILPFERFTFIYKLNQKISFLFWWFFGLIYFQKTKTVLWIFHPRFYWILDLIKIFPLRLFTIYDCLDYVSSIQPSEEKLLRKGEENLFNKSDLTVLNSQFLADFHKEKHWNLVVSPSGFVQPKISFVRHKKHKLVIIGFAGSLNYRVDYDLMYKVAKKTPEYLYKFYGPYYTGEEDTLLQTDKKRDRFFSLNNVQHIDFLSRKELYQEMQNWDLAIIPYNLHVPLNYYCKPLKLYEYFYFGLPVVSVPIPSIKTYGNSIYFAKNTTDWLKALNEALKTKQSKKLLQYKKNEALKNTWEKKLLFIFNYI